ncbi:ribonuclease H protein, partial [Trifolium medium]|nr:ribonuclease H protein [Trifolium medium]
MNVDGSLLGSSQSAGFGGLIRNSDGTFLCGFYDVATQPSILYAEIMAMLHGLELCWKKGFQRVSCFSESLQIVTLVKDGVLPYHKFANEVTSIRQLLDRDWVVAVDHTLREGNTCADMLAKKGTNSISP